MQYDLPWELPPHQRTSPTSRAAAVSIRESVAPRQAAVYAFVAARGDHGATNAEIADGLGMPIQSVCPRVCELRSLGRLVSAGKTRPTATGRPAQVWRAAS